MEKRLNKRLLIAFFVTFAVGLGLVVIGMFISVPRELRTMFLYVVFAFPGIPAILLQWYLCRVGKRWWIKVLPAFFWLVVVTVCVILYAEHTGWNHPGWVFFFATGLGMLLGFLIHTVYNFIKRKK